MVKNDESMDAPKNVLFHWKYNNYEKDVKSSNPGTLQSLSISLGNMKILKINGSNQKSETPRMVIISSVFEEKNDVDAPTQTQQFQECLCLLLFFEEKAMLRLQDKKRKSKNAYIYYSF